VPHLPWPRRDSSDTDRELARIARYEPIQREACQTAGASFVAPSYTKLVWLGPLIVEGHTRVSGTRYAETENWSGWSLTADDRPRPATTEIQFEHLHHLVSIREDLMPYLGLPAGWTFSIFDDGSWRAWSPKDRLVAWLEAFTAEVEATPDQAVAIAELTSEQFEGTELEDRLVGPLLDWASRPDASPDEVSEALLWASLWLREDTRR
jgi:hypothetical protein